MLKIRDLGLNTLPDAYDLATKKGGAKCAHKTHCPLTIPKPKKYSIGHDEAEQLQHQLLHRMAEDTTH